jgi:hypothetical protein
MTANAFKLLHYFKCHIRNKLAVRTSASSTEYYILIAFLLTHIIKKLILIAVLFDIGYSSITELHSLRLRNGTENIPFFATVRIIHSQTRFIVAIRIHT